MALVELPQECGMSSRWKTSSVQDEIQHMFSLSKAFFDLSPEDKAKYGFDLVSPLAPPHADIGFAWSTA